MRFGNWLMAYGVLLVVAGLIASWDGFGIRFESDGARRAEQWVFGALRDLVFFVPFLVAGWLYARDRHCTFPGCRRHRHLEGHHTKHWIDGGETNFDELTPLCEYHHRLHHEGGFSIVKEADGTLRFVTADGRTIPRCGCRLDDFVDDLGGADQSTSAEGFCTTSVQRGFERSEVREMRAVYRAKAPRARPINGYAASQRRAVVT
jgi:hypothetical protein